LGEGPKLKLRGIGKQKLTARILNLPIRLGGEEFQVPVAFTYADTTPQLLGREGLFDRLDVLFKQRNLTGQFLH
jgi:hypothetical protein